MDRGQSLFNRGALFTRVMQAELATAPQDIVGSRRPLFATQVVQLGFEQTWRDLASKIDERVRGTNQKIDAAAVRTRQPMRNTGREPGVALAQFCNKTVEVTIGARRSADPPRKIASWQERSTTPRGPAIAEHRDDRIAGLLGKFA